MADELENVRDRVHETLKHNPDPSADEWTNAMLRSSPSLFGSVMLRGPEKPPYNGRFLTGPHHLVFDDIVTTSRRFAVMAARGSGKSLYFSFALPLWYAVFCPNELGLLIASIDDNAKRIMSELREEIEANPLLRFLYPGVNRRLWSARAIQLSNGHTIHSRSMGSRLRGFHPRYTIGDDILSDEAKYSETYRQKAADWWYSVVGNMPVQGSVLGLVGTALHANDLLYGDLMKNAQYKTADIPCMDTEGNPTWPEHESREQIEEQRKAMGELRFAAEKMNRPVTDSSSLFPRGLFTAGNQMVHLATLGLGLLKLITGLKIVIGVDFAFSASIKADYFVIFVLGVDDHGNRWWVDVLRRQGVPYDEQLTLIKEYGVMYQAELMYLEANQAQRIMSDALIRTTALPIKKFVTTAQKHSLESGLPQLRLLAENQKWRIPRGNPTSIEKTDVVLNELASFTFVKGAVHSLGEHDDTAMALYLAEQAAQQVTKIRFDFGRAPQETAPIGKALVNNPYVTVPGVPPIMPAAPVVMAQPTPQCPPPPGAPQAGPVQVEDHMRDQRHRPMTATEVLLRLGGNF